MNTSRSHRRIQLQYLEGMGVDVWVRRPAAGDDSRASLPANAVSDSRVPDDSAGAVLPTAGDAGDVPIADLDWEALRERVERCQRCDLYRSRTRAVFGVGNRGADLLVIGEAPGAEEDRQGEPFVGRAGRLLDNMLRAMGLDRDTVYITNILKSRPPGNRDPNADEVDACMPYLQRQIALIRPKVILALGRVAAQNLLATDRPLRALRESGHVFGDMGVPVVVSYHPAYLLRSPADKGKAWRDLKAVLAMMREQTE